MHSATVVNPAVPKTPEVFACLHHPLLLCHQALTCMLLSAARCSTPHAGWLWRSQLHWQTHCMEPTPGPGSGGKEATRQAQGSQVCLNAGNSSHRQ